MTMHKLLVVLPWVALVGACGGGNATDEVVRDVPASAMASPDAYARYAGSVPASDSTEPLDLTEVVPPTSESAEPIDLH